MAKISKWITPQLADMLGLALLLGLVWFFSALWSGTLPFTIEPVLSSKDRIAASRSPSSTSTASVASMTPNPCDGVDSSLSEEQKAKLAPIIANEEKVHKVDVLQSLKFGKWQIIYIENYVSDEPYLFYSGDPMITKPVAAWSGAATIHEENAIKEWTLKNAPGIPNKLASCFGWHVTPKSENR
ncbi:hypothetical protein [Sideroxydans sp. CL21]|uniref:hypothetical protein n=1 Tax=Sideroxydans sp. CL21 TaxID=2600596 RepID=UPI0024BC0A56|nr:hypothetical protein [Sideroxydans sp. CL21]